MSSAINAVCALFCLIAFTFYLVALIGHSCIQSVITDIFWIYARSGGEAYFGTRCFYSGAQSPPVIHFEGGQCTGSFCDVCAANGQVAFGLNIVSIVFTTISFGLCCAAAAKTNKDSSISNIVMAFLGFAPSLIGTVLFMSRCYSEINDQFGSSVAEWGAGSILSVIAFIFMGLVSLLQVIDVALMKNGNEGATFGTGTPGRVR